jgi:hypothetical protein
MSQPACAVNSACGKPPPVRGTADIIVDLPTKAFGILPNAIACDPDIDECALVILAARLTYTGTWVMRRSWAQDLVRRGLGEHCYWRGLALLVDRDLIKRRKQGNGRQGHGEVFDDLVCLPPGASAHGRRVERAWFNGALSVKAVATALFIRAQAKSEAQPWQIATRFDWSPATVKTAAEEACDAGLLERLGGPRTPLIAHATRKIRGAKNRGPKKRGAKNRGPYVVINFYALISPYTVINSYEGRTGAILRGLTPRRAPAEPHQHRRSHLRALRAFQGVVAARERPQTRAGASPRTTLPKCSRP